MMDAMPGATSGNEISRTESPLKDRKVAITGRLASMTREEAVAAIQKLGGTYHPRVERDTTTLVLGMEGWPLRKDGRLTHALRAARRQQEQGAELSIIPEEEFLVWIGLSERQDGVRRLFTSEQMSRILRVPRAEIREWIRAGLIRPEKTVRRLAYFDFAQVASAKVLSRLREQGVSADRVQRSLKQLKRWCPKAATSLAQIGIIEEGGHLLVRLETGKLADTKGQLYFDFKEPKAEPEDSPRDPSLPRVVNGAAIEDWLEEAVQMERRGELEQAAEAYHRAMLQHGPIAEMCFNLGNVLYAMNRHEASAERFMQAVEMDPEYVEAWNNLGNVLTEMKRYSDAIQSFERALLLEPGYADAHFNLGGCLKEVGDVDGARRHWQEYLSQDPHSSWARKVRELLLNLDEQQ